MKGWHWKSHELTPGLTADELSRRAGRSVDAARSAARRHGVDLKPKRRGWPEKTRARAVDLRRRGYKVRVIASTVGVPLRTVQSWIYEGKSE